MRINRIVLLSAISHLHRTLMVKSSFSKRLAIVCSPCDECRCLIHTFCRNWRKSNRIRKSTFKKKKQPRWNAVFVLRYREKLQVRMLWTYNEWNELSELTCVSFSWTVKIELRSIPIYIMNKLHIGSNNWKKSMW